MSMPVISMHCRPVPMSQAISDLVESIALEEAALSHILNAEGEKIQRVVAMEDVTVTDLLDVNDSVRNTVSSIASLEDMLKDKLEYISDNMFSSITTVPTSPCGCDE
ncbi:MAG: hypothetical protein PHG02_09890 [Oscillospiraceae bacterium]|nr:hypothetical protein [Oscillospiraceae bacterium]